MQTCDSPFDGMTCGYNVACKRCDTLLELVSEYELSEESLESIPGYHESRCSCGYVTLVGNDCEHDELYTADDYDGIAEADWTDYIYNPVE